MHFRKKFNYRRKKGPLPFRYVLLISFIIFIILSIQGIWIVDRGIRPTLLEIANLETQKVATSAINFAVESTIEDLDTTSIINIIKDKNGKITSIGFDAEIYKKVVSQSVLNAQVYLKKMEEGKLHELGVSVKEVVDSDGNITSDNIYYIPLGQVTKNSLLANLGPKVPVKFTIIGDVDVEINEDIQHLGINNTWISLGLDLEVQVQVIIPFATSTEKVTTTIPVGMIYIPGEVPNFYSNEAINTPSLSP